MRIIYLSFTSVLFALFLSGCATSSQQRELSTNIQQLQKEVAGLKEEIKTVQKIATLSSSGQHSRGPNMEKLAKIDFPDDPTKENLTNYINAILVASQGQRSRSSNDPQAAMLMRVGSDNLHLLLDAMPAGTSHSSGTYHLETAMKRLAGNEHKELILKELPVKQRLISIVVQMGWENDAEDTLLEELNNSNGAYLPSGWVKAVASLNDPKTYDALTDYFVTTQNPSQVYDAIYRLPGIELEEAVEQAWENAKHSTSDYTIIRMAKIAALHGHQDAIESLIKILKKPSSRSMHSSYNPRSALMMVLDAHGSNEEIIAWYEENKDRLVFDEKSKRFKRQN